jgi:hypothetical protein
MRHFIFALALAFASPAFAGGNHGSDQSGFLGFGTFATQGQAGSFSAFGGQAESFASGSAGLTFSRCGSCGGTTFSGWQDNQSGALTQGNAIGWGLSQGAAQGFGAFASRGR